MTGEELGREFSRFLNGMGNEAEVNAFVETIARDHRTLQQLAMGVFMRFAEEMSQGGHDLRNAASVGLAKRIMEIPEEERWLPYV